MRRNRRLIRCPWWLPTITVHHRDAPDAPCLLLIAWSVNGQAKGQPSGQPVLLEPPWTEERLGKAVVRELGHSRNWYSLGHGHSEDFPKARRALAKAGAFASTCRIEKDGTSFVLTPVKPTGRAKRLPTSSPADLGCTVLRMLDVPASPTTVSAPSRRRKAGAAQP